MQSKTYQVVNPRNYVGLHDTRTMVIRLPPSKKDWSDGQILASFVKGFFGGWVFTPERILFQVIRPSLVHFSRIPKSEDVDAIWSHRDLSDKQLPPLHSTLFGAFQVLEFYDSDQATSLDSAPPGDSYVDFGFGSDGSIFSGFQRYSLSRSARVHEKVDADDADNSVVRITFSCVACNPMQDKPIKPDFLFVLHKFYAMLLFREGVGQILHPDNGDQSNPLP